MLLRSYSLTQVTNGNIQSTSCVAWNGAAMKCPHSVQVVTYIDTFPRVLMCNLLHVVKAAYLV